MHPTQHGCKGRRTRQAIMRKLKLKKKPRPRVVWKTVPHKDARELLARAIQLILRGSGAKEK